MRLIDADAILNTFCDNCPNRAYCEDREQKCSAYSDTEEILKSAPIIEAEPVNNNPESIDGYITKDDVYRLISDAKVGSPDCERILNDTQTHALCQMLHRLRSKKSEPVGWISVTDEMPKLGERVMAFCRAGILTFLRYDGKVWFEMSSRNEYLISFVTHWQHLPESPKEDKDGKDDKR